MTDQTKASSGTDYQQRTVSLLRDLTLYEVNIASTIIREAADEDANIIFGAVIDENLRDEMKITVLASGFGREAIEIASSSALTASASAPRFVQRPSDDLPRPMIPPRRDDLDVPAFIRKKADSKLS